MAENSLSIIIIDKICLKIEAKAPHMSKNILLSADFIDVQLKIKVRSFFFNDLRMINVVYRQITVFFSEIVRKFVAF